MAKSLNANVGPLNNSTTVSPLDNFLNVTGSGEEKSLYALFIILWRSSSFISEPING